MAVRSSPTTRQRRPRKERRQELSVFGLFAGIGGLELGLKRAGHKTLALCEIDPVAQAVLRKNFGKIAIESDVAKIAHVPQGTSLITAGFPCQDLSAAGTRAGITGSRSGLVGEVFRLLQLRNVEWVLLENVPFMLQLAKGKAIETVTGSLERLGYRWAYRVIDARAFGVPQRRERVFLLASLNHDPRKVLLVNDTDAQEAAPPVPQRRVACGFYWTEGNRGVGWAENAVPTLKGSSTLGIPSPPAVVLPNGEFVTPGISDAERLQGFPSNWTDVKETQVGRGHRWRLLGNAVSVNVASWLGERLRSADLEADRAFAGERRKDGDRWPRAAWNIGDGVFASSVSAFPVRQEPDDLEHFLKHPAPLSHRAAAGFLLRLKRSGLHTPPWFVPALEAYVQSVKRKAA